MFAKKISVLCSLVAMMAVLPSGDLFAATKKAGKQSAIQMGTKVRTKVEVSGLYDQECYDAYYGCMDSFCISDNENGGSCTCSDLNAKYDNELLEIKKILDKAEHVKTVEVEKVQAGANADIIFAGERKYDEDGNIIDVGELTDAEKKKQSRESLMAMFENSYDDEDVFEDEEIDISSLVGDSLYQAAEELCYQQVPEKCEKDLAFLTQVYKRQITSDCKGLENSLSQKRAEAEAALASAEADVRSALKDSLNEANKYDLGTCMVEFKKCMMTEDACGKDWSNCVSTIADANMQGISEAETFKKDNMSSAATKAFDASAYGIAASTMEGLDSKRIICERVLNQCVMVRDQVWPAFLREAAPTIKIAETKAESKMRQSCLTEVSDCIQKACKDDIAGKGVDTMDACLARPDMARSFCKIEIDRCERMEPQIWAYVTDKLKAMRVDACTEEVKACFTADTRCGANFQNCIGMDYDYIHDICPIDSLVVCKQDNPNFSMDDLDSMLMGLYLNIDNSALDTCQALVEAKMTEICGSTTDCNRFAADEVIGTGSLRSVKDGNKYRITGMISFGSIKTGDGIVKDEEQKLDVGEIGVAEYIAKVKEMNLKDSSVPDATGIVATIEEELNNIAGTINRTIQLIEQDPEIQYCVSGRDLSQITGKSGDKTTARFPNLLNSVKTQIAVAALRKAQDNYNKKFTEEVTKATKDASIDVAQYMCQMLPVNNGEAGAGATSTVDTSTALAAPFAIVYEVSSGIDNQMLSQGGHGTSALSSGGVIDATAGATKAGEIISSITGMGSHKVKLESGNGTREMWSTFNRETRVCHFCTSVVTKNCKAVSKKGFIGIGAKNELDCTESEPTETCHDIPM